MKNAANYNMSNMINEHSRIRLLSGRMQVTLCQQHLMAICLAQIMSLCGMIQINKWSLNDAIPISLTFYLITIKYYAKYQYQKKSFTKYIKQKKIKMKVR